ncbi:MAG: MotA/TolQ/ExbB proton channel family protein [Planctomycetota bacterium]|nr:MotA/TolQ/ExbB proton channel family protein [Planctomycetota bacterium]
MTKVDQDNGKLSTTDPNPALTALIGAIAAAGLYLLVFLPLHHAYLGRLMIDRGPCQYLSTFITCWGLATLALKFYAVKEQTSYADLELDFIPYDINMQITPRNVGTFLQHVEGMQPKARGSILGRRILGALEHFRARNQVPEVQAYLSSVNQVDSSSVESGYTLLKAFIWLVPILGFIGTVTGISDAVSSLSSQFQSVPAADSVTARSSGGASPDVEGKDTSRDGDQDLADKLVKAMGGVTQGLATAFDTTFLGLVCAIILLFPTEMLRKTEYAMLDRIEVFLYHSIVRRMSDEGHQSPLTPELASVLEPAFQEHQRWLVKWQSQVGELGDVIGRRLEEHMEGIQKRLAESNGSQARLMGDVTTAFAEGARSVTASFESWHQVADRIAGDHQRLLEATTRLQDLLRDNSQRLAELIQKCPDRWQALTVSLDQLREANAASSDRLLQILSDGHAGRSEVQTPSNRGWFAFWKRGR